MIGLRRALVGLAVLAAALACVGVLVVLTGDHAEHPGLDAGVGVLLMSTFIGTGLFAWWRRPDNRIGPLMAATGFAAFVAMLSAASSSVLFTIGVAFGSAYIGIAVHMLLAFPSGRLETGSRRLLAGGAYGVVLGVSPALMLFRPDCGCPAAQEQPANALFLVDAPEVSDAIAAVGSIAAIGIVVGIAAVLVRRWRTAGPRDRTVLAPVLLTGAAMVSLLAVMFAIDVLSSGEQAERIARWAALLAFAALPFAFLAGLVRSRAWQADAVAAALALDNERLDAELRARVRELHASRQRILEAGMAERRRLERDLHDGAQQRLVSLSLQLGLIDTQLTSDPGAARELLGGAREQARAALEELRELAHGIHPAVLTDRGLGPAIETLATRASVPVEVAAVPDERLPAAVEAATYFVVAESLTNVAKYANASHAEVSVERVGDTLVVEVRDDGAGGADPRGGSGLSGLGDRLSALDGQLEVDSEPGRGTLVRGRIPCESY